jgi:hypothetical protein
MSLIAELYHDLAVITLESKGRFSYIVEAMPPHEHSSNAHSHPHPFVLTHGTKERN